jgi:hypothetical protein
MSETERLRPILTYFATLLKANAEASMRLSAEVAALVATVRGLDPTFDDVLNQKRLEMAKAEGQAIRKMLSQFDGIVKLIEEGWIV